MQLEGRVAVVTGASGGLGFEMARSLAAAGAIVYLNGRSDERARAAAERILSEGGDARALAFDVRDEAAAAAAVAKLGREGDGRLDILVNNVGVRLRRPNDEVSAQDIEAVFRANLIAPFLMTRLSTPLMKRGRYGRVVMISSTAALLGARNDTAYAASKAALLAITRSFAVEMGPWGGTCNAIAPGAFLTAPNAEAEATPMGGYLRSRVALGRWGHPHEIGAACVFLASPGSSYVTGALLPVDGGLTAALGSPELQPG